MRPEDVIDTEADDFAEWVTSGRAYYVYAKRTMTDVWSLWAEVFERSQAEAEVERVKSEGYYALVTTAPLRVPA